MQLTFRTESCEIAGPPKLNFPKMGPFIFEIKSATKLRILLAKSACELIKAKALISHANP